MSIDPVTPMLELRTDQIFDHSKLLKTEIDAFLGNFERNQRYKEFDGIIRSSHILYEAVESPVEPLIADNSNIGDLIAELTKTAQRITDYARPRISHDYDDYIRNIHLNQTDIVRIVDYELAKASAAKAAAMQPLEVVEETRESRDFVEI